MGPTCHRWQHDRHAVSHGYTRPAGTLISILRTGLAGQGGVGLGAYIMLSYACLGLLGSARVAAHHGQGARGKHGI